MSVKTAYEVTVTHNPNTYQRLQTPRKFVWKTREETQSQYDRLLRAGLKKHQVIVCLVEVK